MGESAVTLDSGKDAVAGQPMVPRAGPNHRRGPGRLRRPRRPRQDAAILAGLGRTQWSRLTGESRRCPTPSMGQPVTLPSTRFRLSGIGPLLAPRAVFVSGTRLRPALAGDVGHAPTGTPICHSHHLLSAAFRYRDFLTMIAQLQALCPVWGTWYNPHQTAPKRMPP